MDPTTCVACSEEIKAGAKKCKHCGTNQDDPVYTGAVDLPDAEESAEADPPSPKARLSTRAWVGIGVAAALVLGGGTTLAIALIGGPAESEALAMPGVGEQVARTSLAVGMCPNGVPERPVQDYSTLPIVDCTDSHREEVYAALVSPEITEWDADALRDFAESQCTAEFVERVGVDPDESALSFSYYLPSEEDWTAGYRAVACTLFDPRGPKTGLAERETAAREEVVVEPEVAEEEPVSDDAGAAPSTPANPPAAQPPASPAPNNAQQEIDRERDRLLNAIQERNEQIDRLAAEKRALVSEYENTYGPYSPSGPLYLNGDPSAEIALKQEIDDVETAIVNLENDVLILFGQLNALPSP